MLGLVGSPRKGGNTDMLVGRVLEGCSVNGHTTEKIYLYDYTIKPCLDCRACKTGGTCVLEDGMRGLYPRLQTADVIVFGTPLYWYGPAGQMKMLIDRMRPFIENGKLGGKKAVIVVPSEEGPSACRPLVQMLKKSFDYLGLGYGGGVLATAYEKGEVSQEDLKKAYELGESL